MQADDPCFGVRPLGIKYVGPNACSHVSESLRDAMTRVKLSCQKFCRVPCTTERQPDYFSVASPSVVLAGMQICCMQVFSELAGVVICGHTRSHSFLCSCSRLRSGVQGFFCCAAILAQKNI